MFSETEYLYTESVYSHNSNEILTLEVSAEIVTFKYNYILNFTDIRN
jgi:hypothetical protein